LGALRARLLAQPHNSDHKVAWVLQRPANPLPFIRGLVDELAPLGGTLLRATTLDEGFIPGPEDQTTGGSCESSLEAVLWKPA
jgi:hypothetical protein